MLIRERERDDSQEKIFPRVGKIKTWEARFLSSGGGSSQDGSQPTLKHFPTVLLCPLANQNINKRKRQNRSDKYSFTAHETGLNLVLIVQSIGP